MEILDEILNRRSIRKFLANPVEKEKLQHITEAGRLAPSAKNRQAWRFIVIQKKEIIEEIKSAAFGQEHVGQAPVIIAICTTNIDYKMPNEQLSYPIDLSIATSFMLLQAVHEGLGTCCITTYDEPLVKHILTVPYTMKIVMLLLVGYPDQTEEPLTRKSIKQVVSNNHW